MKLFVASSYLNKSEARAVMGILKKAGHEITFDWTKPEKIQTVAQRARKAERDEQGVTEAERLVVVWPGRVGTATEIGIALGQGKKIHILGSPDLPNIYWDHPRVSFVSSVADLLDELGE